MPKCPYGQQRVNILCNKLQDSEQYVEKLLDLFQRFSRLVKEAVNEDPRFLTARDKAYKQVVNDTQVSSTSCKLNT